MWGGELLHPPYASGLFRDGTRELCDHADKYMQSLGGVAWRADGSFKNPKLISGSEGCYTTVMNEKGQIIGIYAGTGSIKQLEGPFKLLGQRVKLGTGQVRTWVARGGMEIPCSARSLLCALSASRCAYVVDGLLACLLKSNQASNADYGGLLPALCCQDVAVIYVDNGRTVGGVLRGFFPTLGASDVKEDVFHVLRRVGDQVPDGHSCKGMRASER